MPGYEKRKVTIDLLKHFSTLSIGVLALSAAFIDKLSSLANNTDIIIFAAMCFFVVIIVSSVAKLILLAKLETIPRNTFAHFTLRWCLIISVSGFLLGSSSFLYMVVVNA